MRSRMGSRLVLACRAHERADRRGGVRMPTPRKPTSPTTEAIDQFCAHFDDLLPRYEERTALRQYVIGLLLPREHNKTLVELGAIVPGAERQRLHHFLHDAPWDADALNRRRLAQWQAHPYLGPHAQGVLIVDETGDPKRGQRIVLAAQQYLGTLGHVATGVVAVTSHWADGSRHVPLGVKPYRPASRLPKGQQDPAVHPDRPGKQLIRYVAEPELGPRYGPTKGVRLVAATLDPATRKPESTW